MKKMMLTMLLFVGITSIASYGQVSKQDLESTISQVGGASGFTKLEVCNVRSYPSTGSSYLASYSYDYSTNGYELKETCICIKKYADNSKSKVTGMFAIAYDGISSVYVGSTVLIIYLKE